MEPAKPELYTNQLYHDFLQENWKNTVYPDYGSNLDFNQFWFTSLHDGVIVNTKENTALPRFNFNAFSAIGNVKKNNGFSLIFKPGYALGDGRFANNGWLQEMHPILSQR